MTRRADFYAALAIALGAMFTGAWLGRSEIVFLAHPYFNVEHWRP